MFVHLYLVQQFVETPAAAKSIATLLWYDVTSFVWGNFTAISQEHTYVDIYLPRQI